MLEKMPEAFKGESTTKTDYIATTPRKWTKEEIEWVKKLQADGYTAAEIAYSTDRSLTSVKIKLQKLSKRENTYNEKHVQEKYDINEAFVEEIKPESVLDLYAGKKNFYKDFNATTNDINEQLETDYHRDALKLLCELYAKDKSYDLIDLDPYGSAYDCYDLAIKMANKGLCITLGEMGHQRWSRLDFVGSRYNITDLKDFTTGNMIQHIQQIGIRNKKKLTIYKLKEWKI